MTSIPPCGSHPFIVGVSVVRAEITNIFGPKDSMQDTTLLAGATMLLSNERNYCHTSGQRVRDSSKALRERGRSSRPKSDFARKWERAKSGGENQQFSNITITKERVMRNKKKSHEI